MKNTLLLLLSALLFGNVSIAQTENSTSPKVICMAFTPDDKKMVTGCQDGSIQIWNGLGQLILNKKIAIDDNSSSTNSEVKKIAISPSGKLIVVEMGNYQTFLLDGKGNIISKLSEQGHYYFSPDSRYLFIVRNYYGNILRYDETGKAINDVNIIPEVKNNKDEKPDIQIQGFAVKPDGGLIAVCRYTMNAKKEVYSFWIHEIDNNMNVTRKNQIPFDPTVHNANIGTNQDCQKIIISGWCSRPKKMLYEGFHFEPSTGIITKGDNYCSVSEYFITPDGNDITKMGYHWVGIGSISYDIPNLQNDDQFFLTGDRQRVVVVYQGKAIQMHSIKNKGKLFDFDDSKVVPDIELASNTVTQLPKADINTSAPYIDPTLLSTPDAIEMTLQNAHNDEINNLAYSPDGKLLVSASKDGTVKIWNRKGMILHTLQESGPVYALAFSPDGKMIITAHQDINIWTVGGTLIRSIKNHNKLIGDIAIDPNGKYIASCSSSENFITLWGSDSLPIRKFVGHSSRGVNRVVFSPDGKTLVSAAGDMFKPTDDGIILWSIDGTIIKKIPAAPAYIRALNFSPNGAYFASAFGNEIKIWDKNGNFIRTIPTDKNSSVYTVAFSPDSKRIASGGFDKLVSICNIDGTSRKYLSTLNGSGYINTIAFTPDGQTVASGQTGVKITEWSCEGKPPFSYDGNNNFLYNLALSPDGKTIISGQKYESVKWDFEGRMLQTIPFEWGVLSNCVNSPDGKWIVTGQKESISIYNSSGELIKKITPAHVQYVNQIVFTPDSKNFVSCSGDGQIKIWSYDGTLIRTIVGNSNYDAIDAIAISPDNSYIAALSPQYIKLWDFNGKLLNTLNRPDDGDKDIIRMDVPSIVSISPDNNLIAGFFTRKQIVLWDRNGNFVKAINPLPNEGRFTSLSFSPNSQLLVTGMQRNPIHIFSVDGTLKKTLLGHTGKVVGTLFTKDGNSIVSGSKDGTVRIWDMETGNSSIMYALGKEYLVYTPDGYWDGSKNCGSLVPMVKGTSVFGIDQFALKNNRPDIILERIKQGTPELIAHYKNQHKRRLRKAGFTEDQLSGEMLLPESKIVEVKQDGKFADISFTLKDSLYSLKKYNVYVNDVPLFGAYGKSITGKTQTLTEKVEFTQGKNKIEISCMNDRGSESFRALAYADFNGQAKGDLYFLAFGVSKYQNPAYNLAYADKDAKDLTSVIDGLKGKGYANVYTKILTNEQVTPDAIKASKDFAKNAKPDDTFILFIAGHGMHDKDAEATYYYLTSNADINNLKGTAADFETIEDLLQGIPPRNKLFLMDACESGEIDDEAQGQMIASATGAGISSRGFKTTSSPSTLNSQPSTKRSYLYQKDRYIYNDLARRSGAIVFSSSKGGEFSYERSDIENGLFTENIMKAITTTEADKNGDGVVSTDELRDYVSAQVTKASNDLQHPTVDRDNIYQKFGFQVK